MKLRYFLVSVATLIIVFSIFVMAAQGDCPIKSDTNIVFYGETGNGGVGTISKSWVIHFLDWWKQQDTNIKYVILDSRDVKTDCNLANYPNLKLYIQPGGDAYKQQNKLGSDGKTNIQNFINTGGAYFGSCAGFYYAANDYYWQGSYYNWPNMLDYYPATVEGSITDIADYDSPNPYALTPLSTDFNAIYYGGPTIEWKHTTGPAPGVTEATYTAISNNLPAIIKYNNALLTSVHLEAFENDGITGLSTQDRTENYKYLANLINEVAGTNFYVPPYLNPECGDGIDNDLDGKIDYPADPGCIDANDNSEIDGPIEIFSNNFESGTLSGWTLTKVSGANYWTSSTTNPYQGTYHAQSQPMSTTEPASTIERAISTSGYSNIKFSYYRRLIGLDIADEFKAKWYDGATWQVLEQTGSNSANDAGYLYKDFTLPSSANNNPNFKIKFECTAGATSEYCRVDNVKITVN